MSATFSKPPSSWSVACSLAAAALLGSGLAAVLLKKKNQRTKHHRLDLKKLSRLIDQSSWWHCWIGSSSNTSYWLHHVSIPISNLPTDLRDTAKATDEGLVACHVLIEHEKIATVLAASGQDDDDLLATTPKSKLVQAHGCVFVPCFVDAHTHLVKTQVVPRCRNTTGSMNEACQVELSGERYNWTDVTDVQRRMEFGIQCARHYGTRAMRTHLDGTATFDSPAITQAVYAAYDAVVEKHANEITLQGVANLFLPLWLQEPLATDFANQAATHSGVVLGSYTGNPSSEERPQTCEAMKALFRHANRLGMEVDFHIDEANDPSCCVLLCLIDALQYARRELAYKGKVVLGHCCSLSLQSEERQVYICQQLAQLQDVHIIANPFTNVGLQDRRGSCPPFGLNIPAAVPRTPQWRGLTLVQELDAAGVASVSVASDNVRDHWHPYGDFDLLTVWTQSLLLGHLDTAPSAGAWAHMVNDSPARAMGLLPSQNSSCFQAGRSADGILFPSARRISELLARPQTDRIVLRKGQVQMSQLPDFADLDDLVASPTSHRN